jgi:hypothetical protein
MDESESFTFARETKNPSLYAVLFAQKLMLCYLFGRIDEAERISTLIDKERSLETFSSLALGDLYLYQSLTALAGKASRRRAVRLPRKKLKKLKFIARLNPNTFQSQVLNVEAETAVVKDEAICLTRQLNLPEKIESWAKLRLPMSVRRLHSCGVHVQEPQQTSTLRRPEPRTLHGEPPPKWNKSSA